jgi:hypothetical protein
MARTANFVPTSAVRTSGGIRALVTNGDKPTKWTSGRDSHHAFGRDANLPMLLKKSLVTVILPGRRIGNGHPLLGERL